MSAITTTVSFLRNLLILGLLLTVSSPSTLHAASRSCDSAIPLSAGETWRDAGREAGDGACFELDLDSAGILMIDVSTAVQAAPARLIFAGTDAAAFARIQHSAGGLILAVSRGRYRIRVESEDPRQRLPSFSLRTRFAAGFIKSETNSVAPEARQNQGVEVEPDPFADPGFAKSETNSETEVEPDPFADPGFAKSETNSETEVEPDPFADPGFAKSETNSETEVEPDPFADPGFTKSETNSETEVEPDPFADPGGHKSETNSETEVEPDPFAVPPGLRSHDLAAAIEWVRPRLAELCAQSAVDDHGDSFACATILAPGRSTKGEIGNDWGDDSDVFRFRVSALGTVEIQAYGDVELAGELYDRHGQRLATVAGDAESLRLARSLVPGTYFVRLAGRDGVAGSYSIAVGSGSR